MAAKERNKLVESQSVNRIEKPQIPLFEGAPGHAVTIERFYTERQIALALWLGNGVNSKAAALLSCTPTTIRKRLETNRRLREVKRYAKEAKLDRCEIVVGDPVDQPCVYCHSPVVSVPDYLASCPARQAIGDDGREARLAPNVIIVGSRQERSGPLGDLHKFGDDGHVILVSIDPTERRVLAWRILERQASDRGYGADREKPVEISDAVLRGISDDRLPEIAERLEQGERLQDILMLERAS